jgi:hypothetical protein
MFCWVEYVKFFYFIENNFFFRKTILKKKIFNIKVLFLKPFYYSDLYQPLNNKKLNAKKLIFSSAYRLGPVGVFLYTKADFLISNCATSNNLDKKYIANKLNKYGKNSPNYKYAQNQLKKSVYPNKLNFNKYDMVIALEDSISDNIISKYPSVLWAKFYEDHKKKGFKKDLFLGSDSCDLIFNQTQGYTPYSFLRNKSNIDFSYSFGNSKLLKDLKINVKKKNRIICEIYQPQNMVNSLIEADVGDVYKLDSTLSLRKYLQLLASSKIFFCPILHIPRWGNSLIEAAMCQCLIVGNPKNFYNPILIDKNLECSSFEEGLLILKNLIKNPKLYKKYLKLQNKKLDYINFERPIMQIKEFLLNKKIKKVYNYFW